MLGSWQGVNGRKKIENPCSTDSSPPVKIGSRSMKLIESHLICSMAPMSEELRVELPFQWRRPPPGSHPE